MGKFIVSSDFLTIINTDSVKCIFFATEKKAIMASMVSAGNQFLGTCQSEEIGKIAIQIIGESLARNEVVYIPSEADIRAITALEETRAHGLTGEKTKGHGGS